MHQPATVDEVREAVTELSHVRLRGGGTKSALSSEANLSTAGLSGILEYQPSEFTFTALAGTPVSVIRDALGANGQYLPFDPPWVEAGATLGGTVATGLSGAGRYRYGGVRDFLLGVRLVTGEGRLVHGGGRVVKNAAGFDIPKLMIGSLGRLGVLVETTFKVFPTPTATATLLAEFGRLEDALAAMEQFAMSKFDLAALDLEPPGRLWIRLGGLAPAMAARVGRVREMLGAGPAITLDEDDGKLWRDVSEFAWSPAGSSVVKIPLTPHQIPELENMLASLEPAVGRRYSVGGNVAWLAWPTQLDEALLSAICARLGRPALGLTGRGLGLAEAPVWSNLLLLRLQSVFDPRGKLSPTQPLAAAT